MWFSPDKTGMMDVNSICCQSYINWFCHKRHSYIAKTNLAVSHKRGFLYLFSLVNKLWRGYCVIPVWCGPECFTTPEYTLQSMGFPQFYFQLWRSELKSPGVQFAISIKQKKLQGLECSLLTFLDLFMSSNSALNYHHR